MKKYYIILIALISSLNLFSQNSDDLLRYSSSRISGTARSTSLSNAVGALGGDYTSIGINPAGIAVYRSNEFTLTPSLNYFNSKSNYYDQSNDSKSFSAKLGQLGYVATFKPMYNALDNIVNTNFAIGYSRNNNFKKQHFISGNNIMSSLLNEFVYYAENTNPTYLDARTGHAYDSYLIDPINKDANDNSNIKSEYFHAFQGFDNQDNVVWGPDKGIYQSRTIDESGYSSEFEFGGGFNFKNKLYFGGLINFPSFSYRQNIQHHEAVEPSDNPWTYLENYTFEEKLRANGLGFMLKAGLLFRPTNHLRVGIAFHSPTFFSIDERFSYSTTLPKGFQEKTLQEKTLYNSDVNEFSYLLITPYKAIGSLAYTFVNKGLISFDYEFVDYSVAQFQLIEADVYENSYFADVNKEINNTLTQTHNFRVGAEFRPTELFTLRAGYGLYQSPYKSSFLNYDDKHQTFSGGFGIKLNNMFVDAAYILRQEQNYYSLYYNDFIDDNYQKPATINSSLHNILVTIGWRF